MADMILQVNHLSKSFGSHEVLRDIDFTVKKGDVTSIIGASGSGKSTLLRCINLLEIPTSGEILYHGQNVAARGVKAPEYRSLAVCLYPVYLRNNRNTAPMWVWCSSPSTCSTT